MEAAKRWLRYLAAIPPLAVNEEAQTLAKTLIAKHLVPGGVAEDAVHIAICAVHRVEYLLTWNCRHLANAMMRRRIERQVLKAGYECPVICTPEELTEDNI